MKKIGIFDCPPVKINDYVEFIYGCNSTEQYNYKCRARGKVICINGNSDILIELPQNFKKVGDIRGWIADEYNTGYGCCKNKLYWWTETYRKIEKELEIE